MVHSTAQLVALTCHFNGRARGLAVQSFFPQNSTCKFCEYVRFVRPRPGPSGISPTWETSAPTPDDWLPSDAMPGRSAWILHQKVDDPGISDRMSAGFVGGGGRWSLITKTGRLSDVWEAKWEVGDRDRPDQQIWRVSYGLVRESMNIELPGLPRLDALKTDLRKTPGDILAFADTHRVEWFADRFREAIVCLSADDPFKSVFHKDLAPAGLLDLSAAQLLAACQAAWVFGGMGSWNDMGFDGEDQAIYERTSERLFSLLNECICAGTNSAVGGAE